MKRRCSTAVALAMLVARTATAECLPPPVPAVTLPPPREAASSPRATLSRLLPRLTVIARAPETLATLTPLDRPFGALPDETRWEILCSWNFEPERSPAGVRDGPEIDSKIPALVLAWRELSRRVACPRNRDLEGRASDAVRLAEIEALLDVATHDAFSNARRQPAPER